MPQIVHVIEVDGKRIELNLSEARVIIRGDVPKRLAKDLEKRGIKLPPRGTIPFHIEGRDGELVLFRSEAHMRRVA